MPLYQFKDKSPSLAEGVFIAPSADIIGDVTLGQNANLWYNVVARGDINKIVIGENTNIQDLSMLHVIDDIPLIVEHNVSVGHHVTLHACTIEHSCLIGMGATVLDGACIGSNSVVAAGSVVPPGKSYPSGVMIMGSPAVVKRDLTAAELYQYANHYKSYLIAKDEFLKNIRRL
jgi:carbonic anhydrase/acetyltransferase-like protein (isoleucine patch superfamily)